MRTKESVLNILSSCKDSDGFVSGQELAKICAVSRTSIWKAIQSLRKDGIEIYAATNKGYKLCRESVYSKQAIQEKLAGKIGINIEFFDSLDSTNTEAKRRLLHKEPKTLHKTVFVAIEQTSGRGRLGRSFFSPAHTGIYFSLIYADRKISEPAKITSIAAVGVCRALHKIFNINPKIKWVNDIYLNEKKICGILTEGITNFETGTIETAIIGVGINLCINKNLPQDLKDKAGAIFSSNDKINKSLVCASVISEIVQILDGGIEVFTKAIEEYKLRSNLIGKKITVTPIIDNDKENFECTATGITDDARLIVKLSDGTEKILESGEVSLHKL